MVMSRIWDDRGSIGAMPNLEVFLPQLPVQSRGYEHSRENIPLAPGYFQGFARNRPRRTVICLRTFRANGPRWAATRMCESTQSGFDGPHDFRCAVQGIGACDFRKDF